MREIIESRRNENIKFAAYVSKSSPFRKKEGLCFLEGARLCADAALSGKKIKALFLTPKAEIKYEKYIGRIAKSADKIYTIDPNISEYLADTKNPQGVFCICEISKPKNKIIEIEHTGNYLALENIQNPDNLGAALRTAEAFGISGVILGGNCCDAYSPKALRSGMGAIFRLPVYIEKDMTAAVRQLNALGFTTFAAVPDRAAMPVTEASFENPSAIVIGNEGNGLTAETVQECKKCVTIPMPGRAESLNASAAASILMWEMMRHMAYGGDTHG